jgi:general stress protein 26
MSNNGDVEYEGNSWFFSFEDTRKISEIRTIADVSLTFTEPPSLLGNREFLSRCKERHLLSRIKNC